MRKSYEESKALEGRILQLKMTLKYLTSVFSQDKLSVKIETKCFGQTNITPLFFDDRVGPSDNEDTKAVIEFITIRIQNLEKEFNETK